jgi:hypothetical protein
MFEFPTGVWNWKYVENRIQQLFNDDVMVYVTSWRWRILISVYQRFGGKYSLYHQEK